jgi:hypothetical protein
VDLGFHPPLYKFKKKFKNFKPFTTKSVEHSTEYKETNITIRRREVMQMITDK